MLDACNAYIMLALAWHGSNTLLSKQWLAAIPANLQHDLVPRCELLANVHNTTWLSVLCDDWYCYAGWHCTTVNVNCY